MTKIRIQMICGGTITTDEIESDVSMWQAIGNVLQIGGYTPNLKDFVAHDGWLQYTCYDGTTVRARRLFA